MQQKMCQSRQKDFFSLWVQTVFCADCQVNHDFARAFSLLRRILASVIFRFAQIHKSPAASALQTPRMRFCAKKFCVFCTPAKFFCVFFASFVKLYKKRRMEGEAPYAVRLCECNIHLCSGPYAEWLHSSDWKRPPEVLLELFARDTEELRVKENRQERYRNPAQ